MNRLEKAVEFKELINANLNATRKLIRVDELDGIFKYENKLYKVIQGHTSLENWVPDGLPALYLNLLPDNTIPEWKQPTMAEDAYKLDDKVIYNSEIWVSTSDNNTWKPGEYGWTLEV